MGVIAGCDSMAVTNRVGRFLSGAVATPGDCYLFYNRTWHGAPSSSGVPRTAIILTFLPQSQQSDSRRLPGELLCRLEPHWRAALEGGPPLFENCGSSATEIGPDFVVEERCSVGMLSPWRVSIMLAGVCDAAMGVYRRVRSIRKAS